MSKFNVVRLFEAARKSRELDRFYDDFQEAIDNREISLSDFSITELFSGLVEGGHHFATQWRANPDNRESLLEAGVDSSAFVNITGQLMVNEVLTGYQDPAFMADRLVRTISTRLPHGEKVIGLAEIGNEAEGIGEAKPYPYVAFGEEWIETPPTNKRGMIVGLTRETIVQDLTGQLVENAQRVGHWMGYNKEIRVLQTVLGITDSYKRKNKAVVQTYNDNTGDHDFDNLASPNALVDWTDIEAAELLFDGMTDPNTGTPIVVIPNTIIVPTALKHTARKIINATEIQTVDNQAAAGTVRTVSANPVAGAYAIESTQLVYTVTGSTSTWFLGDFRKAFAYMEVAPVQVVQAPANNHDEFHRDIINQWKVSEWGVPAVMDPRYAVKCTA